MVDRDLRADSDESLNFIASKCMEMLRLHVLVQEKPLPNATL
jgi:hypothetical protein